MFFTLSMGFSYAFFPVFCLIAFIEYLGASFFQAFFAGLGFTIAYGLIIGAVLASYWFWEGSSSPKDPLLTLNGYYTDLYKYFTLLLFELATVSAKIFTWDVTYSTGGKSNPMPVMYALHQNIQGFIYWRSILFTCLIVVILHVYQGSMAYRATKMIKYRIAEPETKKEI